MDVWRQRNFAQGVQYFIEVRRAGEAEAPVSFLIFVEHSRFYAAKRALRVAEDDLCSDSRSVGGAQHDPPIVGRVFFQQQNVESPARVLIHSSETSGNHSRIVECQNVVRKQVL